MAGARGLVNPDFNLPCLQNNFQGTSQVRSQPDQKGEASDVLMWEGNGPPPTELSQGNQVANPTSPPFKIIKKSINKDEAVAKLRKYILSINDDEAKTQIWVQSSNPYPLSISLKQIKDLLKDTNGMDKECFNMVVRVNATDEARLFMDTNDHIFDLRFSTLVADSSIDPKQRLLFDDKREIMARICDHWPGMLYHVSECNSIWLPFRTYGQYYILFLFDMDKRTITLLDPSPEREIVKPGVHHKYLLKLKEISIYLNITLQYAIKGWKDDVFHWHLITPSVLPTNHDSRMSGFLVLTYMRWWNGKEVVRADGKVAYALRIKAVVHMLSYRDNECADNIPQIVRELVNMAGIDFFV